MNNDLIRRQDVIEVLKEMHINRPLDSDRYIISDFRNKIVSLPSVETERKKGEWVANGVEEGMVFPVYTCSVCGGFVGLDTSRFCPECGAEMKRGDEEE